MLFKIITSTLILLGSQTAEARSFESSYQNCVRHNIEKAKTAQQVAIIKNTCKEKFSSKPATAQPKSKAFSCTPKSTDDYCKFLIESKKAIQKLW